MSLFFQKSSLRSPLPHHIDIFCAVIDNFGDLGMSLRLAHAFLHCTPTQVTLWLNKPDLLNKISPLKLHYTYLICQGSLCIKNWAPPTAPLFQKNDQKHLVIEAFGCTAPTWFLTQLLHSSTPFYWIHLDYLNLDPWGPRLHQASNQHPQHGFKRRFFVPSIQSHTGGIIHSDCPKLTTRPNALKPCKSFKVLLFCYPSHPGLNTLLSLWQQHGASQHSACQVECFIPPGILNPQQNALFFSDPGHHKRLGRLHLHYLDYLSQAEFEQYIQHSDFCFVRGEDSFIRAQLHAQPFVWQAYPQTEHLHLKKIDFFLHLYLKHYGFKCTHPKITAQIYCLWQYWNQAQHHTPPAQKFWQTWQGLYCSLPLWKKHALNWHWSLKRPHSLEHRLLTLEQSTAKTVT